MNINNFKVTVTEQFSRGVHFSHNIIIWFLIKGTARINLMQKSYGLKQEDFLIINKNWRYEIEETQDCLAAVVEISYSMLCEVMNKNIVRFDGNSVVNKGVKYEKFRYIMGELLNEYAINYENITLSKLSSLYKLCDYMVQYFAVARIPAEASSNMKLENILEYLEKNYNKKISLAEISSEFYMAPTSFSRYFHKEMGMTYMSYLNQLRLNIAEEALIYTNHPITEVALDTGFSNISGFNKMFKKEYGVSPRQYREQYKKGHSKEEKENKKKVEESLEKYRNRTRLTVVMEQRVKDIEICADTGNRELVANPWTKMIHLGNASTLLLAEYQKQISILKNELGFEYGVLTGIFSSEMKLRNGHNVEQINYSYLDNVLDCLVGNNIYPVISFEDQDLSIIKSSKGKAPLEYELFESYQECISVIERLIRHFVYRYGKEEVNKWEFDLWYNEFREETLSLQVEYNVVWDGIYECIRSILPDARIGGSGTGPSVGYDRQMEFYQKWKQAKNRPDFISVNMMPYYQSENRKALEPIRRELKDFILEDMNELKRVLEHTGFSEVPVCALMWNLSLVQRNYFNDTLAKAATMLLQMTQAMPEISAAAFYPASDLQGGDFDSVNILNGACGLLSKDGIRKPAFYAMKFMNRLLKCQISKGEHHIITTDGRGNMAILLFNSKGLNHNYYSRPEEEIGLDVVDNIFLDSDVLEITLTLSNMKNGKYHIHKQIIGVGYGDILNEWRHIGTELPLTLDDMNYMNHKCIPHRENHEVDVKNEKLLLIERLNPHESMLLEIEAAKN